MALRAQFHYLLTVNEVLFTAFLLIFIITEADSMHEIRNNRIFFTFKGDAVACRHPLNTPMCIVSETSF